MKKKDFLIKLAKVFKKKSISENDRVEELDSLNLDLRAKSKNYSEYIESFVGPTLKEMFFETNYKT